MLGSGSVPAKGLGMLMTMQHSKMTRVLATACFALALTAFGCGDDEGDGGDPVAGTGGASGSAGTGGTGGATAGAGGAAAATTATCTAKTTPILGAERAACTTCVCTKAPMLAQACAENAQCWPLLLCASASGCGQTDIACISMACSASISGAGPATPFGTPIVTGMCSAECVTSDADGGADDAGL